MAFRTPPNPLPDGSVLSEYFQQIWENLVLGDIASLIAAIAFVALVAFIAVPLIKLGKVFDAATTSIEEVTDHTIPILDESVQTVTAANAQLAKVDTVTTSAAEVSQNISALTGLYSAVLGGPLIKVASFSYGVRKAVGNAATKVAGNRKGRRS